MQDTSDSFLSGRDFQPFFRKLNQKRLQYCDFVSAIAREFLYATSREITGVSGETLADGSVISSISSCSVCSKLLGLHCVKCRTG